MRNVKRILYFVISFVITYYVYNISVIFYKLGLKDISKEIIFIALGIFFVIPVFRSIKIRSNVSDKSESIYLMDKAYSKIKSYDAVKLQGLTLKGTKHTEYIDGIVITERGLFNIVYCNYRGKIAINDEGKWLKERKGKITKLEDPFKKVLKNRDILLENFNSDEVNDVVVLINDRTEIEGIEELPVIRHYDLAKFIESNRYKDEYDSDELYDKLYPLIYKEKDINKEKESYEKYLDMKWSFRSRVLVISMAYTLYICNVLLK